MTSVPREGCPGWRRRRKISDGSLSMRIGVASECGEELCQRFEHQPADGVQVDRVTRRGIGCLSWWRPLIAHPIPIHHLLPKPLSAQLPRLAYGQVVPHVAGADARRTNSVPGPEPKRPAPCHPRAHARFVRADRAMPRAPSIGGAQSHRRSSAAIENSVSSRVGLGSTLSSVTVDLVSSRRSVIVDSVGTQTPS